MNCMKGYRVLIIIQPTTDNILPRCTLGQTSLRKSFAQRVYEESGDIYLVQELLGHRNVSTTQKYIGVNYATARETVEAMALGSKRDRIDFCHVPFVF